MRLARTAPSRIGISASPSGYGEVESVLRLPAGLRRRRSAGIRARPHVERSGRPAGAAAQGSGAAGRRRSSPALGGLVARSCTALAEAPLTSASAGALALPAAAGPTPNGWRARDRSAAPVGRSPRCSPTSCGWSGMERPSLPFPPRGSRRVSSALSAVGQLPVGGSRGGGGRSRSGRSPTVTPSVGGN
ncbi:unnamed protein product [Dicrocoelium dendriticum]|nr:unnamed protein product [Dicrocoelium dendriticum]